MQNISISSIIGIHLLFPMVQYTPYINSSTNYYKSLLNQNLNIKASSIISLLWYIQSNIINSQFVTNCNVKFHNTGQMALHLININQISQLSYFSKSMKHVPRRQQIRLLLNSAFSNLISLLGSGYVTVDIAISKLGYFCTITF